MKQSKLIKEIDGFTGIVHTYLKKSNNLQCWRTLMNFSRELNWKIKENFILKEQARKDLKEKLILSEGERMFLWTNYFEVGEDVKFKDILAHIEIRLSQKVDEVLE